MSGSNLNAQNNNGDTPLMEACFYKREELIKILIQNGADVLIKNKRGEDAFNFAMKQGNLEMIKMIKEAAKKQVSKRRIASQLIAQSVQRQNGV